MSNATEKMVLTREQESFVWYYVCLRIERDDRNPNEVIEQDYDGDRSHYFKDMAARYRIHFCNVCGKPKKEDILVFQENVENKGVNLCGACAVEYQTNWRLENPGQPDVLRFISLKNLVQA